MSEDSWVVTSGREAYLQTEQLLENAVEFVYFVSPWLTQKIASLILNKCKNINTFIVMRDMCKINQHSIKLMRENHEEMNDNSIAFDLRFHPPLHSKLIVAENLAVIQSGNLTKRSYFVDDNLYTFFTSDSDLYEEYLDVAKKYYEMAIPEQEYSLMQSPEIIASNPEVKERVEKSMNYARKLVKLYSLL